jgi:eukaryotic-like serine/threonine-protein kinase
MWKWGQSPQVTMHGGVSVEDMVFGRRYRVVEKIGSGGMAVVYRAVDETLGRTVAVKVLHARYAADPNFAARFRQEASAAANLQSPYIVNIYDWGQENDTYYIVMELVRGTDLKTLIEQKGALDSKRVAELGAQVCSALAVAHGYDVIHRDIKPHNIMVTPDGQAKVMDFGIARAGNTTMTQTGSVLGTAHYVSPEQAQGKPLTPASDLYSLGVVLFEASTGRLPFDADTPVAVALKQVNEAAPMPRTINPNIDPGLEAVIVTAMAKDPNARYDTADAMRRDLLRVAQGREVEAAVPILAAAAAAAAAGAAMPADQTAVMPQVGGEDPYAAPSRRTPNGAKKKPSQWLWVAIAAAVIIAGLGIAWAMGLIGNQGVPVPDVTGKTQTEAETLITEAGFVLGDVKEANSADIESGLVIDQTPIAGATAEKESAVGITVSTGPKQVEVPDLVGKPEDEAINLLTEAGFTPEPLPNEFDSKIAVGSVIRQDPAAGTSIDEGSKVQYVVSRGVEMVRVPNVEGKKQSSATSTLKDAGFKVSVTSQFSDTVNSGIVISQNPKRDLQVAKGSTVTIYVSKGAKQKAIPDVVGQSEADATAELENAGFKVTVVYELHSSSGTVLSQDPSGGTKADKGSTVTIKVDGGAP